MPAKSLLIAFMLCISGIVFSQTEIYTIYLKNGSTYKGMVVEKIPGETITIQTAENEKLKLSYDDIQKITLTEALEKNEYAKTDSIQPYRYKRRGFINYTEVSFSKGYGEVGNAGSNNKNTDRSFGIRTVNGFQFSEHISVGLGIGLEKYINVLLVPVTFDLRFTFKKGKTSPTLNINAGGAPNIKGVKEGGGFVVNPSFGIKTYVSRKTAFFFNVGYKIQQNSYDYQTGISGQTISFSSALNFVTFSAGLAF